MNAGPKPMPERAQTDESLRTERENADRVMAARLATLEEDAEKVVLLARENADAVLVAARDKADEHLEATHEPDEVRATVAEERAHEDDVLRAEHAAADEAIHRQHDENVRALSRLLPLERQKTDRYLLTERSRSDESLGNRDDFLSIVSHDLRSLLGGIVISADMLQASAPQDGGGSNEIVAVSTARIHRYAARMNRLIGDLVDVASIDAGKLTMKVERGSPTKLVAEAIDAFHVPASAQGIHLRAADVDGEVTARFDFDRMQQVMANLITNALKFTPQGGAIEVRCATVGDDLTFSVRDTGVGISRELLEQIFERFWKVAEFDRRGLGLGLYISRCIVEAHGGKIWAESTPGKGSTFRFTLPGATAT